MIRKFTGMLLCCLCLAWTDAYAQKNHNEWGNYKRYDKANKELAAPTKKEKRVVFMGNGYAFIRNSSRKTITLAAASADKPPINSCFASVTM